VTAEPAPDPIAAVERVIGPALIPRLLGLGRGHRAIVQPGGLELRNGGATGVLVDAAARPVIERRRGWFWDRIKLRLGDTPAEVRALRRADADRLEALLALGSATEAIQHANCEFQRLELRDAYLNRRSYVAWREAAPDLPSAIVELARTAGEWIPGHWRDALQRFRYLLEHGEAEVQVRNEHYTRDALLRYRPLFDGLESNPLSGMQREAIVRDEDSALVVAGAGTGKTSTVVGKVGFLLAHDRIDPGHILLLAFGKKAATEMAERVERRLGASVEIRTFHSLGREIIRSSEQRAPSLSPLAGDEVALDAAITRYLSDLLESPQAATVVQFLAFHRYPAEPAEAFASLGEYYEHIRSHGPRSLRGERVKSWEELFIANWLCLHGVRYEYERQYEHPTGSALHREYRPDFYLPDFKLYLEHFGIGRDGSTAPYVDINRYHESIAWKRGLHARHGTTLIETYSFDRMEGSLGRALEERLSTAGVRFSPLDSAEVKALLTPEERSPVAPLLRAFLKLYKGNLWSMEEVRAQRAGGAYALRTGVFLDLFELVYGKYQDELFAAREIDFDDMIRSATEHVEAGRWRSPFTRIVVDEFQDISRGRVRLLQALLAQQADGRIFAVGDDWQSIFRFTGSDVALMTGFDRVFGYTHRTDLDQTFRFDEGLLEVSSRFITRNPAQLKKNLRAVRRSQGPAVELIEGKVEEGLERALGLIDVLEGSDGEPIASVMVLGRYRHSCPPPILSAAATRHPTLRLSYRTVHRSKGLEADYVVLVDVITGRYGFPTEMADDPVLRTVLATETGIENAEERRLFYVALTRARKRVYIVTDPARMSVFARELITPDYAGRVAGSLASATPLECPACITGRVRRIEGPYGPFWGCTLYPYCTSRLTVCSRCEEAPMVPRPHAFVCANEHCAHSVPRCPLCGARLVQRHSAYGPFVGCSSFPGCRHRRDGSI
jgi:DNA helicase IV